LTRVPADQFRSVLRHLPTGVCLVAAFDRQVPVGMAVNSVTSVSLDPPLVLVCPARASTTWPALRAAREFCLSVMAGHHEELCQIFASRGIDRFEQVEWHGRTGGPALDEAVAWLDCRIHAEYEAGDHTIVVAEVIGADASESAAEPLVFFRGRYGSFIEPST
jgi:3-hydroxy-9,10-secoandrosta-1,3,5(10)-triene-9,17-dione monooxygenase reductase component